MTHGDTITQIQTRKLQSREPSFDNKITRKDGESLDLKKFSHTCNVLTLFDSNLN